MIDVALQPILSSIRLSNCLSISYPLPLQSTLPRLEPPIPRRPRLVAPIRLAALPITIHSHNSLFLDPLLCISPSPSLCLFPSQILPLTPLASPSCIPPRIIHRCSASRVIIGGALPFRLVDPANPCCTAHGQRLLLFHSPLSPSICRMPTANLSSLLPPSHPSQSPTAVPSSPSPLNPLRAVPCLIPPLFSFLHCAQWLWLPGRTSLPR
jgi:hypothetical protein